MSATAPMAAIDRTRPGPGQGEDVGPDEPHQVGAQAQPDQPRPDPDGDDVLDQSQTEDGQHAEDDDHVARPGQAPAIEVTDACRPDHDQAPRKQESDRRECGAGDRQPADELGETRLGIGGGRG